LVRTHLESNDASGPHDKFEAPPRSYAGHTTSESRISADILTIALFMKNFYIDVSFLFP
jgi:hypothetical protein